MGDDGGRTTWTIRGHLHDHAPSLALSLQSTQYDPLFSQIHIIQLGKKKSAWEIPQTANFLRRERSHRLRSHKDSAFGGPRATVPAGLGLHQRPEDGGVWQEDRTAPDKQGRGTTGFPQKLCAGWGAGWSPRGLKHSLGPDL